MDLGSVVYAALVNVLGVGAASGVRAVQPLLLLAISARFGLVPAPAHLQFLTSTPAIGALVALLLIEEVFERDDDISELLGSLKYGLHGSGAALASYVLLDKLDLPLDGWPIAAIAVVLSLLTHGLRIRAHDVLRDIEIGFFSPREWLSWLETGGVLGVMVALLLAPVLVLVIVVLAAVVGAVFALLAKFIERSRRRPCPVCSVPIRKEASLCPHCHEPVEPTKWLARGALSRLELNGIASGSQVVAEAMAGVKNGASALVEKAARIKSETRRPS